MICYYLDPSAWVKRYCQESGSEEVQALFTPEAILACATLGEVEVAATLARKRRAGEIAAPTFAAQTAALAQDWRRFVRVQLTAGVMDAARDVSLRSGLRSALAMHSAAAAALHGRLQALGTTLVFVSTDADLLAAIDELGIETWDPTASPMHGLEAGGVAAPGSPLRILQDPDPAVRAAAVEAIGSAGGLRALNTLTTVLRTDPHWSVRSQAVASLAHACGAESAQIIVEALQDPSDVVRHAVAQALRSLGAAAVPGLMRCLQEEHPPRETVVAAFGLLGAHGIEPLMAQLSDGNPQTRPAIIDALGATRHSRAVETLIGLLHDHQVGVRCAAARALASTGDERALPALMELLQDSHAEVQAVAAQALGTLGNRATIDLLARAAAVHPLTEALVRGRAEVRAAAANALGYLQDESAKTALIEALGDAGFEVRREAARALGRMGEEKLPMLLLSALAGQGAWSTAELDARAVPPLIRTLSHPDAGRRRNAAVLLGSVGDERALEPLAATLRDEDADVRCASAQALRKFARAAIEPLIEALADPDAEVRKAVITTLGHSGDPRATVPLAGALAFPSTAERCAAAAALGRLGAAAYKALPRLQDLRRGSDGELAAACRGASERIEDALRDAPAELEAASPDAGRGTELEAASDAGRGMEPEADTSA